MFYETNLVSVATSKRIMKRTVLYLILRHLGFCHDISLCILSYLESERCFIDLEIARFFECDLHFNCVFTDFHTITVKGQSLLLAEYFDRMIDFYDVIVRTLEDYVVFQREMHEELPFVIKFEARFRKISVVCVITNQRI